MPELRTDRLTGHTVLVAENRARRPNEFSDVAAHESATGEVASATEQLKSVCPFCPGQEHLTPPAVYELSDSSGNWRIRVVPNKFPAVTLLPDSPTLQAADSNAAIAALGVHEVIIESERHIDRLSELSVSDLRDVLETYALRLRHWRDDPRLAYGLVFKNQGQRAGALLAHLHSQFVALPAIPATVEAELRRAQVDLQQRGTCPYCRLIQNELSLAERVIHDDDGFMVFCPFVSLQPYEVWLMPSRHEAAFEMSPPEVLDRLAIVLRGVAGRIESIVPAGAYNLLLRTAPWHVQGDAWSHWRIELLPRFTAFAGFELASGIFINPVAPERAAGKLRSI